MTENNVLNNGKLRHKLRKLFEAAAEQSGCQNIVEAAKKLYSKQSNVDLFLKEFLHILQYCLLFPDKAAADKILLFVAKFAASLYSVKALQQDNEESEEDLEHPFLTGLLNFIFQTHSAISVDARLRCTQLINHILSAMPDDSWLPVSIWNGLAEVTRNRLQDRNPGVRVAAVLVARKLQEPKDPKCEIVKLLSFHMTDIAPAVRRSVIASIALTRHTIGDVIGRTLDISENVRRNAFAALAKVRFQNLKITQRITLLERGLRDRVEKVRQCVETVLIAQWIDHVDNNVWTLLEGLDVVNCPDIVGEALEPIIKIMTIEKVVEALKLNPETRLMPVEHLNPETALAWKVLTNHASGKKLDDVLEDILPNISAFCGLLRELVEQPDPTEDDWLKVKRKHVMCHLLELALNFDLSDELGRKNLRGQIITMLINPKINDMLVDKLVELLFVVVPDVDHVLMTLTETISEIREPLTQVAEQPVEITKETQVTVCGYKLALNDLKEREYEAATAKNYAEAARLQSEITELEEKIASLLVPAVAVLSEVREEKTDAETVCKCLKILVKMIPCSKITRLTPGLKCLREDFLSSCLTSEDLMTQSLAIQALAQFCVLDKELAEENLLKFLLMLSEEGNDEINIPALKAVFDILQMNGTECFNKVTVNLTPTKRSEVEEVEDINLSQIGENELSVPAEKCIAALKELMNSTTNEGMKLVAFEGFCKLLLSGVIYSPTLLKNIIIKGFTPIRGNETEDRIRQLFMVFFPLFVRKSRRSQDMIEAAFLPVLRAINDAPLGSPEADINSRDVALFLIDATKPGINQFTSPTVHVHNNLALGICKDILKDVVAYEDIELDVNYLKVLLQLQLSLRDEALTAELRALSEKIIKKTNDSGNLRLIKQFRFKLHTEESVSSIQNTLENTPMDQNLAQTTLPDKQPLETVSESLEISSIEDEDETAITRPNVIAESPEISDESD